MKNIKHMLDVVDKVRDHVALGLMSDPGLSKTSQVKQWAEENERRYCELIISQRMPSEISGMPMPVQDTKKMEVFDFETLLELQDGDVLAFDEFTNGNIQTLNACLTLIQERTMLSGKKLPSLLIVAMGNPQGKCDLLPQTKQRFLWVDVVWDPGTWKQYMKEKWGINVNGVITGAITSQYKNGFGNAAEYNYWTPRTMENLFRIAREIPIEDEFWKTFPITAEYVSGLYDSISNKDPFTEVKKEILGWLGGQVMDDNLFAVLVAGIDQCKTNAQLRQFIEHIEEQKLYPELIEYLMTTELTANA